MNLVEGIQAERKRVEDLRKEYVAIGHIGGRPCSVDVCI